MDFEEVLERIKNIAFTVFCVSGAVVMAVSAIAMVYALFK